MEALKFQVQLKIRRPAAEVFDAVADPKKLSGYFIREASGPLVEGATVQWRFPEFDEWFPVEVREVSRPERIVLAWDAADGPYKTLIEMAFKPIDEANTLVQISESGWRDTPEGRKASYGNCGGWMHMMMGLKGWIEYGINLRAGGAL
ncbi:MAG: SRPBCC domain-containing protein [Myxococcaceae bacterium]|nr:SRPBCC domain-containing protein [Myxococcaceae bacterium]